jgi:hypothetical protein
MTKGKKKLNYFGKITVVFLVAVVCFSGWVGYTSFHYDLPLVEVAKNSARYVTLTAVSLGVSVYDSSVASSTHAELGPKDTEISGKSFPKIEDYLGGERMQGVQLIEVHNEQIITGHYDFLYQPDVPRLREMRKEMELDKVVSGATDELEKMVRLRQWVREQFSRSDYQKQMKQFDALSIWRNPQKNPSKRAAIMGAEYMPCHFFPLFYSQVMLAMGYTPRVVGITYTGYGAHGFVEVWSNQYHKWISMDPDLNLHYELNGIPQNMLEVHNARYQSTSKIEVLQGIVEPGFQPEETVENMLEYHKYIKIADLRNDWLSNEYFLGHPARSDLATLFWEDEREAEAWRISPETSNSDDMYWTLNQAEIHVQPEKTGQNTLGLVFRTVTPNFSHFIIRVTGKSFNEKSSTFAWQLQEGRNELVVYPLNSLGVKGISSRIKLYYTPGK